MVPHFAGRLASPLEDQDRESILAGLEHEPMDYFRRFYADTAMLGGPTVVADTIADISSLGLPEADEAAIFAGNARRLLKVAA
jgi:hypothetical protein